MPFSAVQAFHLAFPFKSNEKNPGAGEVLSPKLAYLNNPYNLSLSSSEVLSINYLTSSDANKNFF